jgi:hypothetical protein
MARKFNTYRRTGTTVPRVQEILYTTGQSFGRNALVVLDVNGSVVECASPSPPSVTGVALNAVGTKPGYDLPNASTTTVVTGTRQAVSVALADREQEFSCRGVNGATDPQIPVQSDIGKQFGVLKTAGGDWVLNYADQVNVIVQVTDIVILDATHSYFVVKFIASMTTLP